MTSLAPACRPWVALRRGVWVLLRFISAALAGDRFSPSGRCQRQTLGTVVVLPQPGAVMRKLGTAAIELEHRSTCVRCSLQVGTGRWHRRAGARGRSGRPDVPEGCGNVYSERSDLVVTHSPWGVCGLGCRVAAGLPAAPACGVRMMGQTLGQAGGGAGLSGVEAPGCRGDGLDWPGRTTGQRHGAVGGSGYTRMADWLCCRAGGWARPALGGDVRQRRPPAVAESLVLPVNGPRLRRGNGCDPAPTGAG